MMMANILMVYWDQQNIILVMVQHLEDMMKEIVEFLILMFSTIIMFKDMLELLNQIQELL
jgi:lipopolysaccharide biosynthesis protein